MNKNIKLSTWYSLLGMGMMFGTHFILAMNLDISNMPDVVKEYSQKGGISFIAKECVRRSMYLYGYPSLLHEIKQDESPYVSIIHKCAKPDKVYCLSNEDGTFFAHQVFSIVNQMNIADALPIKNYGPVKNYGKGNVALQWLAHGRANVKFIDFDCVWQPTEDVNVVEVTAYFYNKPALLALLDKINELHKDDDNY